MPTHSCIVVADDNHDAADSLAQLLGLMGYDAVAVYDGEQAVRACHDLHPDLAILDVQMPLLDGCAAARRIRDDEELAHDRVRALRPRVPVSTGSPPASNATAGAAPAGPAA
ncbi:MAG: response regulator [Burkholderiales bacterium]|nr:response regulator [Burkholderiales bacterium]